MPVDKPAAPEVLHFHLLLGNPRTRVPESDPFAQDSQHIRRLLTSQHALGLRRIDLTQHSAGAVKDQ